MRSDFDKIIQLTSSKEIQDGADLPKVYLHKWLCLGQTEYVCANGTLGDGFEKLTDSQKYAQAIKELYSVSVSIKSNQAQAKRAKADLIDAVDLIESATKSSDKLRAEASKEEAETRLYTLLVSIEDQMRQAKVYHRCISVLGPSVEAQYPGGIEQAEPDNWATVFQYRMQKGRVPGLATPQIDNIPLDTATKAALGYQYGRLDAIAPLAIANPRDCHKLEQSFNQNLLEKKEA